jgi:hypothetical protein
MKYLKPYKIFESSIAIHTPYKSIMDYYLNKLGISLDDLNDIFVGMLDLNHDSYLQLFYVDKNGSSWSIIPSIISESQPFIPYLSISFSHDEGITRTIKNSIGLDVVLFDKIDLLEAFYDSVNRLKSMFPDKEIYWKFNGKGSTEVRIYFDEITKEPEIE